MFNHLEEINRRPAPWERYTADLLWTDPWISGQMLALHLDESSEAASRGSEFIQRAAAWMTDRFGLASGRAVADFGCGPGLYASRLAQQGARVTGIDFSRGSIDYARAQAAEAGLAIDYRCQNYLECQLDQGFDLIILIYCDFCALSPKQRGRLLAMFRDALKPGGALLLDVFSTARFAGLQETTRYEVFPEGGFWAGGPHHVFSRTFLYPEQHLALDKYTIITPDQTRVVYNWLAHFDPQGLEAELAAHGFTLLETLGSVAGDPHDPASGQFAVVAQAV